MKLKIKKLTGQSKLPTYAKPGDAGMDLYAAEEMILLPFSNKSTASLLALKQDNPVVNKIHTGIAMEIPDGCVGLIMDKSGLASKYSLKVFGGVIDSSYRGEVVVCLINFGYRPLKIKVGEKIAQLLIQKVERPEILEYEVLSESERGDKGFGSTGK